MKIKKRNRRRDENGNVIDDGKPFFEYITAENVYDMIAKGSNLTPEQVRYVFQKYRQLLDYSIKNKLQLALGTIGYFTFDIKKGKKAGTKVNVFETDEEATARLGKTKKNTMQKKYAVKILEKDKPSYMLSSFVINKSIQDYCRETTSEVISDIYDSVKGD